MTPVDAVLATAEPLMVPVRADDNTATKAAPPLILPATTFEISMTKSLAPETTKKPPKIMNNAMFEDEIFARIPKRPSSLYIVRNNTSSNGRLAVLNTPGRCSPKNKIYETDTIIRKEITQPETRLEKSRAAKIRSNPAVQSKMLNCQDCPVMARVSSYIRDSAATTQQAAAATKAP